MRMDELFEHKLDKLTQDIDDLRILIKGIMTELRSIQTQVAGLEQPRQVRIEQPTEGTIGAQLKSIHQLVKGHHPTS